MAATTKDDKAIALAKELRNVPWCEDYEKMISGMLYVLSPATSHHHALADFNACARYNCLAPELMDGRFLARRVMHKYNNTFPDDATVHSLTAHREAVLHGILGKVGSDVFIEPPFNVDYGCNIMLGDKFYANFG